MQATGIPVSTLRCGMIVGPGGSSLENSHQSRSPTNVMGLPTWSTSKSQPIAIQDVLRAVHLCLEHPETYTGSFDIGGPERLVYRDLIAMTAEVMEKKRLMFLMPFISVVFSKRWVAVFGSGSVDLVGPLIDSLRHTMLVTSNPLQEQWSRPPSLFEPVSDSMDERGFPLQNPRKRMKSSKHTIREQRRVRSVQRLPLPPNKDARWTVEEYVLAAKVLVADFTVQVEGQQVRFYLRFISTPLLELTMRDGGTEHHTVLAVTDGLLPTWKRVQKDALNFEKSSMASL